MNPDSLLPSVMRRQIVAIALIEREIATAFGLRPDELRNRGREDRWTWPRQVAMHVMNELSGAPHRIIAERFGKERTTVMHACRRVRAMMDSYPKLKRELTALQRKIENENRSAGQTTMAGRSDDLPEGKLARFPGTGGRERVL